MDLPCSASATSVRQEAPLPPATTTTSATRFSLAVIIGMSFLLTLVQVASLSFFSPKTSFFERYLDGTYHWDSNFYFGIAINGYQLTKITPNIAFPPGYPLTIRIVNSLLPFHQTDISMHLVMLLISQFSMWGVWIYLLLILRRWCISVGTTAMAIIAILTYPSAFYLTIGYSESLFVMMMLGFLFWVQAKRQGHWFLAALHGLVLSATRNVGAIFAVYPLYSILAPSEKKNLRSPWDKVYRFLPAFLTSLFSLLGIGLFLLFIQWKFGDWRLFFSERKAWGETGFHITNMVDLRFYRFLPPFTPDGRLNMQNIPRDAMPCILYFFLLLVATDFLCSMFLKKGGWGLRLGLYILSALMLLVYISMNNVTGPIFPSMMRFSFTAYVLLVLAAAHLFQQFRLTFWTKLTVTIVLLFIFNISFLLQGASAITFLREAMYVG